MGIAGGTYLAIGRPLFHHTPQRLYEKLLTGFIAAFGLALVSF